MCDNLATKALQDIVEPFKNLNKETKMALFERYLDGEIIAARRGNNANWHKTRSPCWNPEVCYRLYKKPQKPLGIPWAYISPEYTWAAMDQDGEVIMFKTKPQKIIDYWHDEKHGRRIDNILRINTKDVDWGESLQQRPSLKG